LRCGDVKDLEVQVRAKEAASPPVLTSTATVLNAFLRLHHPFEIGGKNIE
jgi:hypothetical protein